ncbi:Topoisomerase 1-associated factor 1 [Rhizopus stolonifer]|uniref:Topoisomerase 1-associated factor 1 n=1 Tax=Rhizopus stolonifer TaxID=4846 RepID=A0A367KKT7_RHIST|nr:Topoisomerase 1-associated factor 1 [Rhizopus stolonifer]
MGVKKVYQDTRALMYLRLMAQSFLISCFNAFCGSLVKDIQREDQKIMNQDYARFFYTIRWFLEYHSYEQRATVERKRDQGHVFEHEDKNFDFALVATMLDLKAVLFCLRHMRIKLEEKSWFDLQMIVDCVRQILISIGVMYQSELEEHRTIAEHIQSNLYYEQTSLDLFVDIIKCYKSQSYGYLKSVIMFTHVLLKLLDQYQKGKKVLFVRKKAQKKKAEKEEEEEEEEEDMTYQSYQDSVFNFSLFEKKYMTTEVVNAYCSLLECYHELQSDYFTCITHMFHRMMVKRNVDYVFWKLPVMELFNRILMDYPRLPKSEPLSQLRQFIIYSTRQFFKSAAQYPLLYVEALVPSIRSDRAMWTDTRPLETHEEPTREQSPSPVPTNKNIIDDAMVDLIFAQGQREKEKMANQEEEALLRDDIALEPVDDTLEEDILADDIALEPTDIALDNTPSHSIEPTKPDTESATIFMSDEEEGNINFVSI